MNRGVSPWQGPDFEGQIRRLRTADGVHFTKAGAVKLASYVDHELRRVMSTHVAPVAGSSAEIGHGRSAARCRAGLAAVGKGDRQRRSRGGRRPQQSGALGSDCGKGLKSRRPATGAGRPRRRFFLAATVRECGARGCAAARRIGARGASREERQETGRLCQGRKEQAGQRVRQRFGRDQAAPAGERRSRRRAGAAGAGGLALRQEWFQAYWQAARRWTRSSRQQARSHEIFVHGVGGLTAFTDSPNHQ